MTEPRNLEYTPTSLQKGDRVRMVKDPDRAGTVYAIGPLGDEISVRWDDVPTPVGLDHVTPDELVEIEGYPLHEKLQAAHGQAQTLSMFLDWLGTQGFQLAELKAFYRQREIAMADWDEYGITGELWPVLQKHEDLIGGFLGISPVGLSAEKDLMYRRLTTKEATNG